MSEISDRLLEFRSQHDKSQKEMAELLGIPFRTLQDCERGKTFPSATTLIAYSGIGADLNWILSGEDYKPPAISKHKWAEHFEPIPWFAHDDIRESYKVSDEERHASAKVALSHDRIKRLIPNWQIDISKTFRLASTTLQHTNSLIIFDTQQQKPTEKPAEFLFVNRYLKVCRLQRLSKSTIVCIQNGEISEFSSHNEIVGKVV